METDVLIIGAGPAGLTAAIETASRGLDVTLVDESFTAGGQLPQQTQIIQALPSFYQPMRGIELATKLMDKVNHLSIQFLLKNRVVGLYEDGSVGITDEESVFSVKAKKIVIATGASEIAVPFPKWTLPGIMTIGAAQTLVNRDFVVPGKKAVIVGSSDFAIDVALQLIDVGVNITGVVEARHQIAAREKEKVAQLQGKGISFYLNAHIKEARGKEQVEEIDIQLPEQMLTEKVDTVCLDGGRAPILDVFYQLGCSFGYQEKLGGWLPQYNERFQTDREDVFLAGNAAGISTQGVLLLTGMIAGISVCEELKALSKKEAEQMRASLWKELENLESKDLLQERSHHIGNFLNPKLKDQFIS